MQYLESIMPDSKYTAAGKLIKLKNPTDHSSVVIN